MTATEYTFGGRNIKLFGCDNLSDVSNILKEYTVSEQIEIVSSAKSYGFFDYTITACNNINSATITIRYNTNNNEGVTIKFPSYLILDFLTPTTRKVNLSTECHYYPKMSVNRISKMNLHAYTWLSKYESVVMSLAYCYLIDAKGINDVITYIKEE